MILEFRNRMAKAHQHLSEAERADPANSPLTIIHNSYYAMFHAALAVLVSRMDRPPTKHSGVVGEFGRVVRDLGDEGKAHGRAINEIQELRIDADYTPDVVVPEASLGETLEQAKAFVAFCERLLPDLG